MPAKSIEEKRAYMREYNRELRKTQRAVGWVVDGRLLPRARPEIVKLHEAGLGPLSIAVRMGVDFKLVVDALHRAGVRKRGHRDQDQGDEGWMLGDRGIGC